MDKKKFLIVLGSFLVLFIIIIIAVKDGSEDENDINQAPKLTHENAVEYYVTSAREHDTLVVTTRKDIYSNFKLISSTITKDTLPNIGTETITAEDSSGNEVKKTVPKAYDIYFKSERK